MKKYQVSFINEVGETRCIEVEASGEHDAMMKARNARIDFRDFDKWKLNFCVSAPSGIPEAIKRAEYIFQLKLVRDKIKELRDDDYLYSSDLSAKNVQQINDHLTGACSSIAKAVSWAAQQEPETYNLKVFEKPDRTRMGGDQAMLDEPEEYMRDNPNYPQAFK